MVGGLRGQSVCVGHSSSVSKLSLEADRHKGRREANGRSLRSCQIAKAVTITSFYTVLGQDFSGT